jgi:Fe-Mn family superoxide dismutase
MEYKLKNFERLFEITALSEQSLKNHFALYKGYVSNANKLAEILNSFLKEGETETPEFAELKRRFGWEFNGMRLHEYYFENIKNGGSELDKNSDFFRKIEEVFDGWEKWQKDFKATSAMRGIGWAILYFDAKEKRLFNAWINEHDNGHLAGAIPLLVLDVFEHAYITDFGLKRADYIEVFFKIINWNAVIERFNSIQ